MLWENCTLLFIGTNFHQWIIDQFRVKHWAKIDFFSTTFFFLFPLFFKDNSRTSTNTHNTWRSRNRRGDRSTTRPYVQSSQIFKNKLSSIVSFGLSQNENWMYNYNIFLQYALLVPNKERFWPKVKILL